MIVTRRVFLELVSAIPALKPLLENTTAAAEVIKIPNAISTIATRHHSTSQDRIIGPCRIYDFISSFATPADCQAAIAIIRDDGACLFQTYQNYRATFRWVSVQGGELYIPDGQSALLTILGTHQHDGTEPDLTGRNQDWCHWTSFERPDEKGLYPIATGADILAVAEFDWD